MNVACETVASETDCFARDGFTFIRSLLPLEQVEQLRIAITSISGADERAGVRGLLQRCPAIAALSQSQALLDAVTSLTGDKPFAVRGILFDKNPRANWRVTWHQDLTIAVRERVDMPGFGPWSVKGGVIHSHAPVNVLERMLTTRIHLDDTDETNGALQIIRGSHRSGKLNEAAIARAVQDGETVACVARAGDALVMRPLLLHSSSPAIAPIHRRVIHMEYAMEELPAPLQWFERT